VVTFPVPALGTAIARIGEVDVAGARGRLIQGGVVWPVAGSYARVRGDLGRADLVAIAAGTRIAAGRPEVDPPNGLQVVATTLTVSPLITEARYMSTSQPDVGTVLGGGLTFTGVTLGGGFEDRLYAVQALGTGSVTHTRIGAGTGGGARDAVASTVVPGNGGLAWELSPGVVGYVGYSGSLLGPDAVSALVTLAQRARVLDAASWRATRPQESAGDNGFG
jgi:hypothetical protein